LISDNTDGRGLVASLEREGGLRVVGSSVVLCGMGPVALSALLALIDARAASVSVVSRNVERGVEWLRHLRERLEHDAGAAPARDAAPAAGNSAWPSIEVIDYARAPLRLATAQALIDATPLGMSPTDGAVVAPEALREGLVVLDVVYGHGETALICAAREAGAIGIDGLGMLIEQAALTIEIWAQAQGIPVEAPRTLMRQAALNRL
jgi:shikimate dehydrogenase